MDEYMVKKLPTEYVVRFIWDDDASVWVATSDNVPGLILEDGSLDRLMERVRYTIPDLLELNGISNRPYRLLLESRREMATVNG